MSDTPGGKFEKAVCRTPPESTRFKPGRSGNPRGRPPKKKAEAGSVKASPQSLSEYEAYRPVTIREGDKSVSMSTIQAILRRRHVEALKGNRLTAQSILRELEAKEREDRAQAEETYRTFVDYKRKKSAEFARLKQEGKPVDRPFPHPDDILIDGTRREVHILGPMSPEMSVEQERQIITRDLVLAQARLMEQVRENESARLLRMQAALLHDLLPPSYGGESEEALTKAAAYWHGLDRKETKREIEDLKSRLAALPPPDVKAYVEAREARLERSAAILGLMGDLMGLVGSGQATTEGEFTAKASALLRTSNSKLKAFGKKT